ncbi:hypothetical protein [Paenibacillus sp. sgz500958]|uniref:hypothetical protein n=1 Tax=Paenibacillus sp. sgz500958 TaxID=3242475 RepID=UPI0036D208F4
MKYIIADPDGQSNIELKNILDDIDILDFKGSFTTIGAAGKSIRGEPPEIAFIRIGKAELNAYQLVGEIREHNLSSKIIFISNNGEYAVQAFEYEADGFLLVPFNGEQIKHLLLRCMK